MSIFGRFIARIQGKKPHDGYTAICPYCNRKHSTPTDSINDAFLRIKHKKECAYERGANTKFTVFRDTVYA